VKRIYFHVDLDAFFASVEQNDNPELRRKPVIIGAAPGHRGVVAACSYEARGYGVHSAMPISEAYRRCPNAVYLPVRMQRYHEMSTKVMSLFGAYTPSVQQLSIDEASLDMTGTERLLGLPLEVAKKLKARVRSETGLTISVGIAANRYLAKLASEYGKPDGLYQVAEGSEISFLDSLELHDLWGLGKKTLVRLEELGIDSVQELRRMSLERLQSSMGRAGGAYLYRIVRGEDPGVYRQSRKSHSISNETTFELDTDDIEEIRRTLLALSHQVMFRIIDEKVRPKTVFVKIRFADFRTTTAQRTLETPPVSAEEIYGYATEMLGKRWTGGPLRLLGVGVSTSLDDAEAPRQGELFEGLPDLTPGSPGSRAANDEKRRALEEAVYRMKRGGTPLTKASLLKKGRRSEE